MYFIDELRSFNNDYLFDGNSTYHWLKQMLINPLTEEESYNVIITIMKNYVDYLTSSILGNIRNANSHRLSLIIEIDQWLGCSISEKQEYVFNMLELMLGRFIRLSLGRNLSYLTHEISCFISNEVTISLLVKPTRLSDTDKYHIYLDNIEEEGGWVSTKLRGKEIEHNENY